MFFLVGVMKTFLNKVQSTFKAMHAKFAHVLIEADTKLPARYDEPIIK